MEHNFSENSLLQILSCKLILNYQLDIFSSLFFLCSYFYKIVWFSFLITNIQYVSRSDMKIIFPQETDTDNPPPCFLPLQQPWYNNYSLVLSNVVRGYVIGLYYYCPYLTHHFRLHCTDYHIHCYGKLITSLIRSQILIPVHTTTHNNSFSDTGKYFQFTNNLTNFNKIFGIFLLFTKIFQLSSISDNVANFWLRQQP